MMEVVFWSHPEGEPLGQMKMTAVDFESWLNLAMVSGEGTVRVPEKDWNGRIRAYELEVVSEPSDRTHRFTGLPAREPRVNVWIEPVGTCCPIISYDGDVKPTLTLDRGGSGAEA